MIMHVDSSPVPEGEIDDFEDAWDEIEDYGKKNLATAEKSYIMLEDRAGGDFLSLMGIDGWYDFPRIAMSPLGDGKWGLVEGDAPERVVSAAELKAVVAGFFAASKGRGA